MGQRRQRMKRQEQRRQVEEKPSGSSALGRRALIWGGVAAVAVVILVVGLLAARGTGPAQATTSGSSGSDAIAVSGTDPITGQDVSLSAFEGKPVVLAIWASWCHGCNDEAPHLAEVAKKHSDVAFVGLNFQDSLDGARWFYGEYGWEFPSIGDPNGSKALGLGLQGTPTTIFLDSEHREVARIVGATDEAGFEAAIDQAVNAT